MEPARCLLSFHFYRQTNIADLAGRLTVDGIAPDLFADSGAFSAFSMGASIKLDEYVAWVHKWGRLFSVVANLDVIGDHGASMRNLREMERQGLRPLPVFHTSTVDMTALEDLCEEYDYIALGGMVGYRAEAIMPWLVKCHKVARKHGCCLHGFGQTSWSSLLDLPWYSVDSSSWIGSRYGRVILFDERTGQRETLEVGDVKAWTRYSRLVKSYGFDPVTFMGPRPPWQESDGLAFASYRRVEPWLRQRHGVKEGPLGTGVRLYAAASATSTLIASVDVAMRQRRTVSG